MKVVAKPVLLKRDVEIAPENAVNGKTVIATAIDSMRVPHDVAATQALFGAKGTPDTPGQQAAVRELTAHLKELGVGPAPGVDVIAALQQAELTVGIGKDARVTAADMERAVTRSKQAQHMKPVAQRDLFGFTRVVDAKVGLSAAGLEALASACTTEPGGMERLLRTIDEGPPGGGLVFNPPQSVFELVASLVRQIVRGAGASRQLTLTPELSTWVEQVLSGAGSEAKKAIGGAGAFAANLAAALGIEARFFSADPVPDAIAERFAPGVELVDRHGNAHAPHDHDDASPARTNTSVEYVKGLGLSLFGADRVVVDGEVVPLACSAAGRVILGAQAKDVRPGFGGVDDATLKKMAKDTDIFFFVGAHYLTQNIDAAAAIAETAELAAALGTMKAANPALVVHAQYVVAKKPEHEAVVWAALNGSLDSLALNAVEVAPFVDALHDAGLAALDLDENVPRSAAEDPLHMLEGAWALVDSLGLQRVHLHGFEGDLVISKPGTAGADEPERQTLALVKARQLAANKAANDSGAFSTGDDIWQLAPVVQGSSLAAVHRFADAVQQRYGLSDAARDKVVERWWFKDDATGAVIHFVPSRGIHDRSGGTVSLGDTIDAGGLMFAKTHGRAARLKHGSSFA